MPNLNISALIDAFMQSTDAQGARAALGIGTLPPITGNLKFVSSMNRVAQNNFSVGALGRGYAARIPHRIQGSSIGRMKILINNWYMGLLSGQNAGFIDNAQGFTILGAAFEVNGVTTRIQFGGLDTGTVSAGQVGFTSDYFDPGPIAQGTVCYIKILYQTSVSGYIMSQDVNNLNPVNTGAGQQSTVYDIAVSTPSNVMTAGAFTFTGTAPSVFKTVFSPVMLIGEVPSNHRAYVGIGHSIVDGNNDSTPPATGYAGIFHRALDIANASGCNTAVGGSNSSVWQTADARLTNGIYPFCNSAILMPFINEVSSGVSGANIAAQIATLLGESQAIYTVLRASGVTVIKHHGEAAAISSSDSFATVANQAGTVGKFDPSGLVAQWNSYLAATPPAGVTYVPYRAWQSAPGSYKWRVDGSAFYATADGTHPKSNICAMAAMDIASYM